MQAAAELRVRLEGRVGRESRGGSGAPEHKPLVFVLARAEGGQRREFGRKGRIDGANGQIAGVAEIVRRDGSCVGGGRRRKRGARRCGRKQVVDRRVVEGGNFGCL